ncbi:hypothetical protein BJ944DRAFT_237963 [Cunninghamella echinulata]|nr:hypothetical protein BJ944DRAFT_237963 [Cunninghamella echinulata]
MLILPNKLIIHIISFVDCYVKFVVFNEELDGRQHFREGKHETFINKLLERDADNTFLKKMKDHYFRHNARISIYKAVAVTKNPDVLLLVCAIWESKVPESERIRPPLGRASLIAYRIRIGNADIIKDMKVDIMNVWDMVFGHKPVPSYSDPLVHDTLIRLFHLRNRQHA